MLLPLASLGAKAAEVVDVVVVGAGISGLVTASRLRKAGLSVRVVEAASRVGGRTLNQPLAGGLTVAEGGGQWIGPTQDAVQALMGELGIGRYDSFKDGDAVGGGPGWRDAAGVVDYVQASVRLERMAGRVPLGAPWQAPKAAEWDRMTVADWADRALFTDSGRWILELITVSTLGRLEDISLLWFLFYIASAGSLDHLATEAQRWRIEGGAGRVAERLAASLGEIVVTDAPVSRIAWNAAGARVDAGRHAFRVRRVVVAMMPSMIERIAFAPALPDGRRALQQGWIGSSGTKISLAYERPFWRDLGLSGEAMSEESLVGFTFDNSLAAGQVGVLSGFINDDMQFGPTRADRREAAIEAVVEYFGPQARSPIDYAEKIWAEDPWVGGCVSPLPPGVISTVGSHLRTPVGPIHWAGTETSEKWCGYMDGAVRAGERAASEVVASIRGGSAGTTSEESSRSV